MIAMSEDSTAAPSSPPPWQSQPPPHHSGRRLVRSTSDRYLGGVAGGIAQTYAIDPIIVRVAFIVFVALAGSGLLVYLALWLILPRDDGSLSMMQEPHRNRGVLLLGMVLLAIGVIALLHRLAQHGPFVFDLFWPVVLIGGGLVVLLSRANNDLANPAAAGAPPMPDAGAPPSTAPTEATWPSDAHTYAPTLPPPPGPPAAPTAAATQSAWAPPARWPTPPAPPVPRPPRPPRPPHVLGPLTVSVLLVFVGGAILLGVSGAMSVNVAAVASIALMIVGVALLVGAYFGRARGLIALGIVFTLVAGTLANSDVSVHGPIGNRTYVPVTQSAVRSTYRVAIGNLRVDLRNVQWSRGVHDVHVRVGIGEAEVFVGPDVRVTVTGHAGIGAVRLFDRKTGGVSVDDHNSVGPVAPGTPIVHIDARAGIGDVHVVQAAVLTPEPVQ
jgi:phage shock protein PspC (stress-responsive transcriptional regulator)